MGTTRTPDSSATAAERQWPPDDIASDETVLHPHRESPLVKPWLPASWLPEVPDRPPAGDLPWADPGLLVRRVPRGDGGLRVFCQFVAALLSSNRASGELVELAGLAQLPLSTGRRIAVTSVRGGAGKSALAAVLASVYAARRQDPVLAADADPDRGSLPWRLGVDPRLPLPRLAPLLRTAGRGDLASLAQVLPRTEPGVWVLPGEVPGQPRQVRNVTRALSRLFAVCVTDCGPISTPSTSDVLAVAHTVVVAAPATPDGVHSTYSALVEMSARRGVPMSRIVVVLNAVSRHGIGALRARDAQEAFRRLGARVVSVPHDRHLAAGAPIDVTRIGGATLREVTRLAGHALACADPL